MGALRDLYDRLFGVGKAAIPENRGVSISAPIAIPTGTEKYASGISQTTTGAPKYFNDLQDLMDCPIAWLQIDNIVTIAGNPVSRYALKQLPISGTVKLSDLSGTNEEKLATYYTPLVVSGSSATVNVGTTTTGNAGTSATVTNSGTANDVILNFSIPKGQDGVTPTVSIGSTTTGAAGSNAAVTNSGSGSNVVLNFTVPQGSTGTNGTSATVSVGTVTTGAAGTSASVTNSGTSSAVTLNFTIPKGDKGDTGLQGLSGVTDFKYSGSSTDAHIWGSDFSAYPDLDDILESYHALDSSTGLTTTVGPGYRYTAGTHQIINTSDVTQLYAVTVHANVSRQTGMGSDVDMGIDVYSTNQWIPWGKSMFYITFEGDNGTPINHTTWFKVKAGATLNVRGKIKTVNSEINMGNLMVYSHILA